jgi:hypothetical protein
MVVEQTLNWLNVPAEKTPEADLLREMIGFAAQRLRELDVESRTGAGYGEKSAERVVQRNGLLTKDFQKKIEADAAVQVRGGQFPGRVDHGGARRIHATGAVHPAGSTASRPSRNPSHISAIRARAIARCCSTRAVPRKPRPVDRSANVLERQARQLAGP